MLTTWCFCRPTHTLRSSQCRKECGFCLESSRLDKQAQSRTQQTADCEVVTWMLTLRLVVLPNKAQPVPLLHSTKAQMVGEDDLMSRKKRDCAAIKIFMVEDEAPLSAISR